MAQVQFSCKVMGFLDGSYGKYGEADDSDSQVYVEYNQFFP